MTVPECCLIKLRLFYLKKYMCISALEMASPGNRHCASCIIALSFPDLIKLRNLYAISANYYVDCGCSGGIQGRGRHSQSHRSGQEAAQALTDGQLPAEVRSRSLQIGQLHVPRLRLASSVPSVSWTAQECLGARAAEVRGLVAEHSLEYLLDRF